MVYIHKFEELILLKYPYYPRLSKDSMQALSVFQRYFSQKQKKKNLKFIWNQKRIQIGKQS